jgi:hypothetical protein
VTGFGIKFEMIHSLLGLGFNSFKYFIGHYLAGYK